MLRQQTPVCCMLCAGDTLPADLEDRAYLLSDPNMNQFAAQMMEDPARLKKYITEECINETIVTPRAFEYIYWVESDDLDKLDSDLTMTQCVDNFGAWEQFARYAPYACHCPGLRRCLTRTLSQSDCILRGAHSRILTTVRARHRWPGRIHSTVTEMCSRPLLHSKAHDSGWAWLTVPMTVGPPPSHKVVALAD